MAREEEVLDATRVKRTEIWPGSPEETKTAYIGVGVDWRGMYLAEVTESSARAGYPEFSEYHNSRIRIPDSGPITEALVNGSLNRDSSPSYTISPERLNDAASRLAKPLVSLKPGDHVIVREPGKPLRMSRVYDTRKDLLSRDFALVGDTGDWYRTDGDAAVRGYNDDRSTAIVSATAIDGSIVPLYQAQYEKYQADLAAAREAKAAPQATPQQEQPAAPAATPTRARPVTGATPEEREELIVSGFRDMRIPDPGETGPKAREVIDVNLEVGVESLPALVSRIDQTSQQWNPHNPKMQSRIELAQRIVHGAETFMANADSNTSAARWSAAQAGLTAHAEVLAPLRKKQMPRVLAPSRFEPAPQATTEAQMEM